MLDYSPSVLAAGGSSKLKAGDANNLWGRRGIRRTSSRLGLQLIQRAGPTIFLEQQTFDPLWGRKDPDAGAWFPEQALELAKKAVPRL